MESQALIYVVMGIMYIVIFLVVGSYLVLKQRRNEEREGREKERAEREASASVASTLTSVASSASTLASTAPTVTSAVQRKRMADSEAQEQEVVATMEDIGQENDAKKKEEEGKEVPVAEKSTEEKKED